MVISSIKKLLPRRIRTFDPAQVTTRSHREVDARSVGLRPADVEAIWTAVVQYYAMGLHPALALCIRRRGEVILDRAIGHARGNAPDDRKDAQLVPATPDTLYNFFSGSKSVTAMLVHLLHQREQLHVDEPVVTFVPEFAKHGKSRITIRDILTHHSGIPSAPAEATNLELLNQHEHLFQLICDLKPTFHPGKVPAYHAVTGGFVLREIIERVSGLGIREFLHKELRQPLGFESFDYGVPHEKLDLVAEDAFTGPLPTWPHKNLIEAALGLPMPELVAVSNDSRFRTAIVPSGNIIGTPNEVSRFFELLLSGGSYRGQEIFKPETIQRAVEPYTTGQVDRVLMLPVPYSMGFMLGSDVFGFYGPRCGNAFGHLGFTNVLGWADPDRDISVAFMNTGKPLLSVRFIAWFNVMRVIGTRIPRDHRI